MKCKICKSENIQKITDFQPYNDKEWSFKLFECLECATRFAQREESINYHEELHSTNKSPYMAHYDTAEKIKSLLGTDIDQCEKILSQRSPVIKNVLNYTRTKDKNIAILELGCSSGYVTAYIQELGYKNALGVDISSSAIEYASLTFGDFYALQEKVQKYDVIFHTGLIGCVDNPIEFLQYYLDLLSEDGVMFFNAPDVDSVHETGEVWVSTPPPDLIYLFQKDIFSKIFGNRYSITSAKTISPLIVLRKYMNKYLHKQNNIYPRNFYSESNKNLKPTNQFYKNIVSGVVSVLIKVKILKSYSDEYGLIIKITKA